MKAILITLIPEGARVPLLHLAYLRPRSQSSFRISSGPANHLQRFDLPLVIGGEERMYVDWRKGIEEDEEEEKEEEERIKIK